MAIIQSGLTTDLMTVDPTSKAARVTQYNSSGTELTPLAEGGTVNTELPAAVALADAIANPTVPGVGAFLIAWSGTVWDRVKQFGTGLLGINLRNVAGTEIATAVNPLRTDPTGTTIQPVSDGGGHSQLMEHFFKLHNQFLLRLYHCLQEHLHLLSKHNQE